MDESILRRVEELDLAQMSIQNEMTGPRISVQSGRNGRVAGFCGYAPVLRVFACSCRLSAISIALQRISDHTLKDGRLDSR